jgi:hypothetical protein
VSDYRRFMPEPASTDTARSNTSWRSLLPRDVHCVAQRDPAARSRFEAWTIYPGVHAMAACRIAHALWSRGWHYAPRWLSCVERMSGAGRGDRGRHPGARRGPSRKSGSLRLRPQSPSDSGPVGKALACLLERVAHLEQAAQAGPAAVAAPCRVGCDDRCTPSAHFSSPPDMSSGE